METSENSSREEEDNSCELHVPNFKHKFFNGQPAKRFANLFEQKLNHLVLQKHSMKKTKTNK